MLPRRLALASSVLALVLVACLPVADGAGDAGLTATTQALLLGKWGTLLADGSGDPNNAYYFANAGAWGLISNGACAPGDAYTIENDILSVRVGSTLTDYQASFTEKGTVLNLRTPGPAIPDGGGSSTPRFAFRLLDQKTNHSCNNL